jgi:hypothetical protein
MLNKKKHTKNRNVKEKLKLENEQNSEINSDVSLCKMQQKKRIKSFQIAWHCARWQMVVFTCISKKTFPSLLILFRHLGIERKFSLFF